MKVGHELDLLIAEKVMGWTYRKDNPLNMDCPEMDNPGWWHNPAWDEKEWTCAYCMQRYEMDVIPHYSTDMNAAKEVVLKLQEQGWYLTLIWYRHSSRAEFRNPILDEYVEEWGETPEHAICLGALSIGEDNEEC